MIYPWQVSQWEKLQQQRVLNKLPHALLLRGAQGLGKLAFALHVGHRLLCKTPDNTGQACGECGACKLIAAQTHPDLFILQAQEPGKAIKVDDVRQLTAKLSLTSQYGGYKVAIIVDAHDMNINASNSLLKTLEEPTREVVLILVSSTPQKLPITVRSRCQSITFNAPRTSVAVDWLQAQGVTQAADLLSLSHGAPLRAMELQHSELLDQHQQLMTALLNVAQNQSVIEQAETLHKLPLRALLNWLLDWVQDLIKLHQCGETVQLVHAAQLSQLSALVARSNLVGLYDFLDQLIKHKQLQSIALNTQLLWEDLLLLWFKTLKRV